MLGFEDASASESVSLPKNIGPEGVMFPAKCFSLSAKELNTNVIHWRLFSSLQNKLGAIRQLGAEREAKVSSSAISEQFPLHLVHFVCSVYSHTRNICGV